ncbi:MAG: fibrobacter succinogenes major paralogous domain-containing protein [Bacteroidia bacterium]|nr:fibrobacter succinogenes major paralogous domain-containing protein [Bacteroidia bacterium]
MMNFVAVKIQIGIVFILFSLTTCKRIEPENTVVITTDDIVILSEGVYIFNGTVVSIGKEEITEHGFCWSESGNPVIDGTSIQLGPRKSKGSFSSTVSGLSASKTYYVKAYVITNSIPDYGEEKSFTTPETLRPSITDIDGNVYYTVNIDDQTWMADNLKVTHYTDGSQIQLVEDRVTWFNFGLDDQAYCWYDNIAANGFTYGALYTWPAAMHGSEASDTNPSAVQGVCPDGWHLPSDSEWKQLEMFLGMSQEEADGNDWRGTDEGGKMKHEGTTYWKSPNTGATNESGFNVLPGGWRHGDGFFRNFGISARFWSSSKTGDYAWIRGLDNNSSIVYRNFSGLYEGHSVRCIKDK